MTVSSRARDLGLIGMLLLATSACTEHSTPKDTTRVAGDSALPMVIDTRFPPVLGIALRENGLEKNWCLHTSRNDIRPNDFVKVVFAGGRKFVTATVGAPKQYCVRSDTIAGVRNFALKVDVPDVYSWYGVVVRGDVQGTLDEQRGVFAARLDRDSVMDFIQDCSGVRGMHLFVTSGDTLGPVRWHYEHRGFQYSDNLQPTCNGRFGEPLPDTTNYAEDELPKPPAAMILPWARDADSLEIGTKWFALREGEVRADLAESAIRYLPAAGACGEETGGRAAEPVREGRWLMLLANLPGLTAGPVDVAVVDDSVGHNPVPDSGKTDFADSVSIDYRGKRLKVRAEMAGKYGFRIFASPNGKPLTLYSAKTQDEGSWRVLWAGDIDRDGEPDILLAASRKHSVHGWQVHLSSFGKGNGRWLPVARYSETGC